MYAVIVSLFMIVLVLDLVIAVYKKKPCFFDICLRGLMIFGFLYLIK